MPASFRGVIYLHLLIPFFLLQQEQYQPQDVVSSADVEIEDGGSGNIILEFSPASGGDTLSYSFREGTPVQIDDLAEGSYGLRAWADEDGDGAWDGIWEGDGEATALMGITLPRTNFKLVLRRGPPEPILEANPELVTLYDQAWARSRLAGRTKGCW